MSEEVVVVTLSGGAPWGFRLQGGAEHQMPLQVSKVRKRSKACRAGLREMDELVFINDASCRTLSHAQAMNLIDNDRGTLHLRIKRTPAAYQSVVVLGRAPSPRIDKEYLAALRSLSPPLNPKLPGRTLLLSPINGLECLTSPPDSEAYYGETDSDADVVAQEKQRRQRRRSPSSSPAKSPQVSPQEDELSGYESTQDVCVLPRNYSLGTGPPQQHRMHGVARREVVFEPPQSEWSHRAENSSDNSDQSPSGTGEVDSGFQEPPTVPPPLVSPQRAKEALMLASHLQMVPMVGPVSHPVDEELSVTYMDKAKQAKLHRGESVQDKQVKEARTKCRTIASLLTDAPNPHSKGVLMFKKRRQRAKKYTLTCFGSVDGESCSNTEGETEDESLFPGSESEFDEEGFSAAPDPTWDSGYLDILDKRTSACVVPDREAEISPGLNATSGKGAQLFEQQRKRAEEHNLAQSSLPMPQLQVDPTPTYTSVSPVIPLNFSNGKPLVVSKTSVMLSSPAQTPMPVMPEGLPEQANMLSASIVHNRTARPFNPGCVSHRASTAPVVFRPNAAKKAVSVATIPTFISSSNTEGRKAVSTTSLYIPARPATVNGPAMLSPTKMASGPFSPPPSNYSQYSQNYPNPSTPFSPVSSHSTSLSSVPYCPSQKQTCLSPPCQMVPCQYQPSSAVQAPTTVLSPSFTSTNASTPAPPYSAAPTKQILQNSPAHKVSFNPYISVATSFPDTPDVPVTHQYPLSKPTEGISSQEQRTTVSGARTGILQDAQRRGAKKPMFTTQEEKAAPSYNPELLSLVQNLDDKSRSGVEAGFESGPEEDYLNLGAEACNFMQAQKHKMPPPVAPKPAYSAPESLQMQGKGAELFARRQSRMDRYVVDKHTKSSTQPRDPSPTPSLPALWKYSPNIRAPPPINYNPLLSPSCPPGAQRGSKSNDPSKVGVKAMPGQLKSGIKALDFMSRQPYQLNSSLFCYGGGVPQNTPTYPQNDASMMGNSLHLPKQVPVKANRVYEIKRFSTPTPMSAPTSLTPTVIAPRSATTLGQPMWREDVTSPPLVAPRPMAPFSPPPPVPNVPLPALPIISMAPKTNADPISQTPSAQTCGSFQSGKQFKSAPELSPLSPGFRASGSWSIQNLRVPRPNFSTSSVGLQPKVWRPGSVLY